MHKTGQIIWCWVNSVLYKNRNPGCVTLTFTCNYFSMKLCPTDAFVKYLCFIHKWANFQVVRLIFIYVTFKLSSYCSLRHFNSLENGLCWTSLLDSVMAWPLITESFDAVRQFNSKWRVPELPAFWKVSTLWTWHVLTVSSLFQETHTNHWHHRMWFSLVKIFPSGLNLSILKTHFWISFWSLLWYSENPYIFLIILTYSLCETAWFFGRSFCV